MANLSSSFFFLPKKERVYWCTAVAELCGDKGGSVRGLSFFDGRANGVFQRDKRVSSRPSFFDGRPNGVDNGGDACHIERIKE